METLEYTARLLIAAQAIGGAKALTPAQLTASQRSGQLLAEFTPEPTGAREWSLRKDLCRFLKRAYEQDLMISTEGTASVRLDADSILVTPYGCDRAELEPNDIVLIRRDRREKGKIPTRNLINHQAIYRRHPEVGAILNALPVHTTAFACAHRTIDTRIIPESYVISREVPLLPYAVGYADGEELATAISQANPVVMNENNGVTTVGGTLLEAFDRLEVTEATARVLIGAQGIGRIQQISSEQIGLINKAFLGM